MTNVSVPSEQKLPLASHEVMPTTKMNNDSSRWRHLQNEKGVIVSFI